ncbi:hypothetical protein [Nannocystis exedens]|uniref:hypothetical protein n=1 Tax=Nannocystis exedens TaxID=54 RepID=UPI00117FBE3D|nr:hypothetical protein [Nannocystis exedens]
MDLDGGDLERPWRARRCSGGDVVVSSNLTAAEAWFAGVLLDRVRGWPDLSRFVENFAPH